MSKRINQKRKASGNSADSNDLATIQDLLPRSCKVLSFLEFVAKYAPSLTLDERVRGDEGLRGLVVVPTERLPPAPHVLQAECREPLPSLVDDVVWTLVQRRERSRRMGNRDPVNVLAQGYMISSDASSTTTTNVAASNLQRPGVVCIHPNHNVALCKSSRLFQHLHVAVGDDLFRMLLLHARLFVPMLESGITRGNYLLVCGERLTSQSLAPRKSLLLRKNERSDAIGGRPKKRRKRQSATLDAPQKLHDNDTLSRYALFYSDAYFPRVGLGERHPLNLQATTPERLLGDMTDLYDDRGRKRKTRWKRLRGKGVEIASSILQAHKRCDYHRLLNRYCPLPSIVHEPHGELDLLPMVGQGFSPPEKVVSFVVAVLRQVFPNPFWGSDRNFLSVVESVRAFVLLRRREKFPNKQLMLGIQVTAISWLQASTRGGGGGKKKKQSRSDHEATTTLTLLVLRWLFRGFVIPLLRSNFYVTETEFSAKRVHYYRKPVWSIFRALSMRKLLTKQYRELPPEEFRLRSLQQSMGSSELRLLPKKTGVRPIAHLSRSCVVPTAEESTELANGAGNGPPTKKAKLHGKITPSTNSVLSRVFDVLRFECQLMDCPFGAGLDGLYEFYPKYHRYICSKREPDDVGSPLGLMFASVDIEKCYDNMNQAFLMEVANKKVANQNYFVQQFNMAHMNRVKEAAQIVVRRVTGLPEGYRSMQHVQSELSQRYNNVVIDSRHCQFATKPDVLRLLAEHLRSNNVVTSCRYGKRFLVQTNGVPQGSILSMLLCNVYFGELEQELIGRGNNTVESANTDMLARMVDDFIFISSNKANVANFLRDMYIGKPELGAKVNEDKTAVSSSVCFDIKEGSEVRSVQFAPRARVDLLFPWCGMLFDTTSGEVFVDYSRYHGGLVKDGLTVQHDGSEGLKFANNMEGFVLPRCVPILYDPVLNTLDTIVYNYYQMILFAAIKTAQQLREYRPKVFDRNFLLRCLGNLPEYSSRLIRCALGKQCPTQENMRFVLSDDTAAWLCWHGYSAVFSRLTDFDELAREIAGKKLQMYSTGVYNDGTVLRRALDNIEIRKMIDLSC